MHVLLVCLDNLNGHVSRHIDGFNGVYGEDCVDQRNLEGKISLEFSLRKELCVLNIWLRR